MPTLGSVTRANIVQARVRHGDETITVGFDHSRVTLRWTGHVQMALNQGDVTRMSSAIADVISYWDITQEDGSPFPPSAENIEVLPSKLIGEIFKAVQDESVPGAAEGKASPATTAAASPDSEPTPMSFQNGTDGSTSPTASASPSPT